MTTQELRQSIDKVLGNSIRCLLPSYWWKRLFHQVADVIDEVEQSAAEMVEDAKMPIVESVDELEKLKLAKGSVAAVEKVGESATVKISDCYFSLNWEEDWSKYTIVKGVEEKDNVITDNDAAVLFSASKEMVTKDALQVNKLKSGTFYYIKWTDDEVRISSLEEVNKALSSGKYRAINYVNGSDDYFIDDYFTFYSEKPQPSLYIKGDSWERLAKESDLEGIEGGGEGSSSRVEIRELYVYKNESGSITELTDEQKAWNTETVELVEQGKAVAIVKVKSSVIVLDYIGDNNFLGDVHLGGWGIVLTAVTVKDGNATIEIAEIEADKELSSISQNPVKNWVITAALNNKADKTYVDEAIANAGGGSSINELDITNPAQVRGIIAKVREGEHNIYWVGSETQSSSCLSYHIFDDLQLFAITDDIKMYLFDLTGNRLITDKKNRIYIPASRMASNNPQRVKKNSVIYRLIVNNVISGTDCFLYDDDTYKDHQVVECLVRTVGNSTYVDFTTIIDGNKVTFNLTETGQFEAGGGNATPLITCDSAISDTSENPVQNKVIKAYVDTAIEDAITNTLNTAV